MVAPTKAKQLQSVGFTDRILTEKKIEPKFEINFIFNFF